MRHFDVLRSLHKIHDHIDQGIDRHTDGMEADTAYCQ